MAPSVGPIAKSKIRNFLIAYRWDFANNWVNGFSGRPILGDDCVLDVSTNQAILRPRRYFGECEVESLAIVCLWGVD